MLVLILNKQGGGGGGAEEMGRSGENDWISFLNSPYYSLFFMPLKRGVELLSLYTALSRERRQHSGCSQRSSPPRIGEIFRQIKC